MAAINQPYFHGDIHPKSCNIGEIVDPVALLKKKYIYIYKYTVYIIYCMDSWIGYYYGYPQSYSIIISDTDIAL